MKNFKKVLALVLVLASLLGLATMAGAATEYKDADKINADYTEAIKVLDLIETMQGYPDGNFKPTATITREEAAKVIAIFDNKDADISTYYTSINPFTDEKGRWGESYVGYGYRAGIIAGMNATTYAPTANVTGTQFLKMALVTLGYDQEAEGFVGSSWAVNVLALAKKIGLIDNLADGWKPEKDLTREEAAQILLNALNTSTVEYGQEAKLANFKPTKVLLGKDSDGEVTYTWSYNGKFYVTVAGAVKTGNKLYKDFDLKKEDATDAFYRPYTKWTLGKESVEIMKAPKATFTKKFSACDLLVALGVKESDTKTKIVIDEVYVNGDDNIAFDKYDIYDDADTYEFYWTEEADAADTDGSNTEEAVAWTHGLSNCPDAKGAKHGAQGTLTQVFYNGKDTDGNKHYTITSIDTWLGKVTKVTDKTTSRDNHLKSKGAVMLNAYLISDDQKHENNYGYCDLSESTLGNEGHTGHCDPEKLVAYETEVQDVREIEQNEDGTWPLSFDDPTGLKKDNYVLFTYSFRTQGEYNAKKNEYADYEDGGVQTVDVTEGKDGRLSGYKFGVAAGSDPSETRVDAEYVKDSQHFHMDYNDSKTNKYGTYTFYYDAYGNVIGMEEAKDSTTWGVVDRAWTTYENEGTTIMNAKVVDLDAKTTTSTVKKFKDVDEYMWFVDEAINDASAKNFAYEMAAYLQALTNGQGYKDFAPIYDHLFKVSTDKDGVFSLKVAKKKNSDDYIVNAYGVDPLFVDDDDLTAHTDADKPATSEIKVVNGKPYLTLNLDWNLTFSGGDAYQVYDNDKGISLTANTKFLVHNMDGTYSAYTGYKNVPSLIAHYAEVVFDSDYEGKYVAEVVYLTQDVYTTANKVVAYVGKGADMSEIEVVEDGDTYYNLTAWVDGEETSVYVDLATLNRYFNEKARTFAKGFYELQYTEIDGVKTVKVTKDYNNADHDDEKFLDAPVEAEVIDIDKAIFKYDGETFAIADDCAYYAINGKKVEKTTASEVENLYDKDVDSDYDTDDNDAHQVYAALKDKQVVAIYIILAKND